MKQFIKNKVPYIRYGSEAGLIEKVDVQTMSNSRDATIHMLRSNRENLSEESPLQRGLPMQLMPTQVSMTMLGTPLLDYMQQFFVDLGTNTTLDSLYVVTSISHEISQGKFHTKCKLVPVATYAAFRSAITKLEKGTWLAQKAEM